MEIKNENYKYKITKSGWAMIISIAIIIILLIYLVIQNLSNGHVGGLSQNKANWQAIFLSNGQVYFGNMVSENNDSVIIQNIYYLQDQISLHQGAEQLPKDFPLIKLGKEVHGPYDEMRINRQHIIFVEDMHPDGKIMQAIDKYEQSK